MTAKAEYLSEKAQYLSIYDREPSYSNSAILGVALFLKICQLVFELVELLCNKDIFEETNSNKSFGTQNSL